MNFDSLKEQILDRLRTLWSQIRETSVYIQLRQKYEELTPNAQKGIKIGGIALAVLLVFSIPLSYLSTSSDNVSTFEEYKQTLRDLFQVQKELAQAPEILPPQAPEQIRARAAQIFTEAGIAQDQIRSVVDANTLSDIQTSAIPASVTQRGVVATLLKLNLKQVLDLGYQLQTIAPNLYMTSMDMTANKDDVHYYDVIFRIVGFLVEEVAAPAEDTKKPQAPGGKDK